jgi:hypothetical protein
MTYDTEFWTEGDPEIPIPDPATIDAEWDDPEIAECERTLLRDIARLRGTRPAALAEVEDFILDWLGAHGEPDWGLHPDPPKAFLGAYWTWQESLPVAHGLDDPIEVLFWDCAMWRWSVCRPPADLPEPVLLDIFGCEREMQSAISAIWKRRWPTATREQWVEWYRLTREFHHPERGTTR